MQRKTIAGSVIGGIKATQEVIDFCAENKIYPDTQIIKADQIGWAWKSLLEENKDGIRYVIDIQESLKDIKE